MTLRSVKTVCPRDCYDTCSLLVTVENGKVVTVRGDPDHPVTRGFTCPRGAADIQRTYSKERILYPYIRKSTAGFTRVTWDKALDTVASNLNAILKKYGPESVLQLDYSGNMGLFTEPWAQRLWNSIGAAVHDYTICSASGHEALSLHYGRTYGVEPNELEEKKLIVFWGFNAKISAPHTWALAVKVRNEKGALIVAIDPRKSDTAEAADIWLAPRPGSDIALVYGITRNLIKKNRVDQSFINEWTFGYDFFKEEALRWTGEKVQKTTGLDPKQVEDISEIYFRNKPSATMIGIGLQKSVYGADKVRAVSLLSPLLGLHRGFFYSNGQGRYINKNFISGSIYTQNERKTFSQVGLGQTIEKGEINFLYINNMNPVVTLPDQGAFRRSLKRDDLYTVIHETHWTETTKYADVVLPAQTYLEKEDLVLSYSHSYAAWSNAVQDPLGESKDETWIVAELGKKLGLENEWIHRKPWEVLEEVFADQFEEGNLEDLKKGGTLKLKTRPRDVYQTSTGKIEFSSLKAKELGFDPIPMQNLIPSIKDGFIFLTTCIPKYTHTQFQDVFGPIPPIVWINPRDAEYLGVKEGDAISLSNPLGTIHVEAIVTDRVSPGVLWSPRLLKGLKGEPQNILIQGDAQAIGGGPIFNSTIVKVNSACALN